MKPIQVTCDSSCDLTAELYQKYHIEVIPMGITLEHTRFLEGVDLTVGQMFSKADATGAAPKATAASEEEYRQVFTQYVDAGYQVVHISPSGVLSQGYCNACRAAENMDDVFVVDSQNVSIGSGHLAILAVELSDAAFTAGEITAALNEMKLRSETSFVINSLEYLHRGGRCGGLAVFGANLLKLHPEVRVENGKMRIAGKFRGTQETSILEYVRDSLEGKTNIQHDRVFVAHTGVSSCILEKVRALIHELQPFEEIIAIPAGCTLSSQGGPGCLGIHFLRNK